MHPMGNQSADAAPGGRAATTYREAGVDVAAANAAVATIGRLARTTFGDDGVALPIGHFGGTYRLPAGGDRILVASADGVGTKLKLAFVLGGEAHARVEQNAIAAGRPAIGAAKMPDRQRHAIIAKRRPSQSTDGCDGGVGRRQCHPGFAVGGRRSPSGGSVGALVAHRVHRSRPLPCHANVPSFGDVRPTTNEWARPRPPRRPRTARGSAGWRSGADRD